MREQREAGRGREEREKKRERDSRGSLIPTYTLSETCEPRISCITKNLVSVSRNFLFSFLFFSFRPEASQRPFPMECRRHGGKYDYRRSTGDRQDDEVVELKDCRGKIKIWVPGRRVEKRLI